MKNVHGIIFTNMHEELIHELTAQRCMGSVPVGGRYRLIDFALSNMTNSGIEDVGVITKSNYQSLMDHIGNGREWDLSRKNGGLSILPPFGRSEQNKFSRGTIDALAGVINYIHNNKSDYVLITSSDMMANIDYHKLVDAHAKSRAEITVLYKRMPSQEDSFQNQTVFRLSPDGFVQDMLMNARMSPGSQKNVYLNTFVVERSLLERMIEDGYSRNLSSIDRDILLPAIGRHQVHAHEFKGYASRITSMNSYYDANLAMLDPNVVEALFPIDRPIYTKVRDEAPVRFGHNNSISNALFADGCQIDGHVEDSILFRGVTVKYGAKIKSSVIMQGTYIGPGAHLEHVICDKNVTVLDGHSVIGTANYPVFIAKGAVV